MIFVNLSKSRSLPLPEIYVIGQGGGSNGHKRNDGNFTNFILINDFPSVDPTPH